MAATTHPFPDIRTLPPNLVNQIAAGEVIERPASVVKELLENSIDAGSSRVEVAIGGGGSESIRVSDDGCGIAADQLALAVTSHATSKLPDDEALFHVGTLGFRGEALASIASVSHLTIRSRTEADDSGSEIVVRGGAIESPAPCGAAVGTVVEVRNLFFNTPVRHRFLKTNQTEKGHISEVFTRLALANPRVHFVLRYGDRAVHDLPATTRWSDRIAAFFGTEIAEALIPINSDDGQIRVHGFVCEPSVSRGNTRMQYLFLNGRHIRDRSLQHALGEAYRGMLMVGRHPVCFLRMEMPPEMVDVNVHPTKLEVRFTDGGRVYSRLLQTLRHHFLTSDMTHRVRPPDPAGDEPAPPPAQSVMGLPPRDVEQQRQSVIRWARTGQEGVQRQETGADREPIAGPGGNAATGSSGGSGSSSGGGVPPFRPYPDGRASGFGPPAGLASAAGDVSADHAQSGGDQPVAASGPEGSDGAIETPPAGHGRGDTEPPAVCYLGFQVHNRYLVTQDERGMVVIDQHALHERVLYERVCGKVLREGGRLESQHLLVPEPVSLTPAERSAALEAREALAKVGLEIEDFGGETLLIRAYPAMLPKASPGDMLRTLLEALLGAGKQPEAKDLMNHLLSTIACKAAVKAGDPLSPEEITSLLEQRDLYHDTHHCPHGRPTALFFSRDELDRMFGRLGPRQA